MSHVHHIRLQGPWEAAPLAPAGAAYFKIHLPGEVERLNFSEGGFRLRRRFHRPTGLTPGDRLFLTLPMPGAEIAVQLNGQPLSVAAMTPGTASSAAAGTSRWSIPALEPGNILAITVRGSLDAWSRWREPVVLEIVPANETAD